MAEPFKFDIPVSFDGKSYYHDFRTGITTECERRIVTEPMEARAGENDARTLSGYAALYGSETRIAGLFREVIEPGAFRAALARQDDVRALFNHDPNFVLGRTTAGTLRLSEDARGLRYDVTLPDTQAGRDLWTSIQRGDVSQSSFAFSVDTDEWRDKSADLPLRVIKDVHLFDVSPVTYPAYDETSVSARSQAETIRADAARVPDVDWRAQIATLRAKTATVLVCSPKTR
jgi:HK97 family phage prohead protease